MIYDAAIIGAGPAGVSAALNLRIHDKQFIWIGKKDLSDKISKAERISNYPGFIDAAGPELNAAFTAHIGAMGIEITEAMVNSIMPMGDRYALLAGPDFYEAKTLILATGVNQTGGLQGEAEFLGRGVSYCATCDAPLYRNRTVAVVGYSPREESEAAFLNEVCAKVMYFPVYREETNLPEGVEVIREKVLEIGKAESGPVVKTEKGEYAADGVFVLREAVAPGTLVPGLETEGAHVKVNRKMETNIPGVFACGDITGTPYQYIKAAGEGNVAALSAVKYLEGGN